MKTNVDVAVIGGYAHSSDASVAMGYIPADLADSDSPGEGNVIKAVNIFLSN